MAGISPRNAGISPARAGAVSASALHAVEARISVELGRERADGRPLKAAYERVAHRLGLSARRVRAFHHHEVAPSAVTAEELLAVDAAYRADFAAVAGQIEALRGLIRAEGMGDPLRGLALSALAGGGGTGSAAGAVLGGNPGVAAPAGEE